MCSLRCRNSQNQHSIFHVQYLVKKRIWTNMGTNQYKAPNRKYAKINTIKYRSFDFVLNHGVFPWKSQNESVQSSKHLRTRKVFATRTDSTELLFLSQYHKKNNYACLQRSEINFIQHANRPTPNERTNKLQFDVPLTIPGAYKFRNNRAPRQRLNINANGYWLFRGGWRWRTEHARSRVM